MDTLLRRCLPIVFALSLAACSQVNPDNYDRIREGMTEAEVVAILGKPNDTSAISILGMTGSSSTWVGSEYSIMLQFVNGKVRARSLGRRDIR